MFGTVATGTVSIISFFKRRSTWAYFLMFLWCWILFAFSRHNADSMVYFYRYYNYEALLERNEPLWNMFMYLFNSVMNVEYSAFLVFVATIYMGSILLLLKVFSEGKSPISILLLFIIFPFCIEIVQVRNSLAMAFVNIGLYFLLRGNDKLDIWRFVVFVLIGGWIHSAMFIYLIFVLLRWSKFDVRKKKTWIVALTSVTLFSILAFTGPVFAVLRSFDIDKINIVLNLSEIRTTSQKVSQVMRVLVYFAMLMPLFYYAYKNSEEKNKKFILDLIGINLIVLIIIPIMAFSIDFYRLQRNLTLINLIGLFLFSKKPLTKKDLWTNIGYYALIVTFIGVNFYLQLWRTNDWSKTLVPMLKENRFFNSF